MALMSMTRRRRSCSRRALPPALLAGLALFAAVALLTSCADAARVPAALLLRGGEGEPAAAPGQGQAPAGTDSATTTVTLQVEHAVGDGGEEGLLQPQHVDVDNGVSKPGGFGWLFWLGPYGGAGKYYGHGSDGAGRNHSSSAAAGGGLHRGVSWKAGAATTVVAAAWIL